MTISRRSLLGLAALAPLALVACGRPEEKTHVPAGLTPEMRRLIRASAEEHDIPESLLHRVIQRESQYNPRARNGQYLGLMQIAPQTARTMGYRGPDAGLLDAETNLKYAGAYLRGAWLLSHGSQDQAIKWYARGYYYEAKRRGMLKETGLRR